MGKEISTLVTEKGPVSEEEATKDEETSVGTSKKMSPVVPEEESVTGNSAEIELAKNSLPARASTTGSIQDTVANFVESLISDSDEMHSIPTPGLKPEKVDIEQCGGDAPSVNPSVSDNASAKMQVDKLPIKENEDSDSDCQVIESLSSPSSSKRFKRKQPPRVLDWVRSPDHFKENPSFKYKLPPWVDKFKDLFEYAEHAQPQKINNKRLAWTFRCKHCIGANKLPVRTANDFLRHLKAKHQKLYKKITDANPQYAAKS